MYALELRHVMSRLSNLESKVVYDSSLLCQYYVYNDRYHAGQVLADFTSDLVQPCRGRLIVMAIPCGGVPVAVQIVKRYSVLLDLIICRKIQIPWNPEAGYGAVAPDGTIVLNEKLVERLGFTESEIKIHVEKTLAEIKRRNQIFRRGRDYERLDGKHVILVDDGLASGYTMLAAVKFVRNLGAERVVIATPTASISAVELLVEHVDKIYCPNIRSDIFGFAVADAYRNWYDLDDSEVLSCLEQVRDLYIPWRA